MTDIPELPSGTEEEKAGWREWFLSRPPAVQDLIREFQPNDRIDIAGVTHYVIGYTESDMLIITQLPPWEDFQKAMDAKEYIHAAHCRPSGRAKP